MELIAKIFSTELINAFGWTLVHSVWQGALIAVILAVLLIFMKDFTSPSRYIVTSLALLVVLSSSAATFISAYGVEKEIMNIQQTAPLKETVVQQSPAATESLNPEKAKSDSFVAYFAHYFEKNFPLIVTVWFLGILVFTLRFIGGYAYSQRLKVHRVRPLKNEWQRILKNLAEKINLDKPVGLVESALIKVPMVIGHLKPVILLPLGMITKLPKDQVETVLAHELAHILRRDYLVNILQHIVDILFFYHPGVRWISTHVRDERENCCDDIAMEATGEPVKFVKALTTLHAQQETGEALAVAALSKTTKFVSRAKRLLERPKTDSNFTEGFTIAVVLAAMLLMVYGCTSATSNSTVLASGAEHEFVSFTENGKEGTGEDYTTNYQERNIRVTKIYADENTQVMIKGFMKQEYYNRNETIFWVEDAETGKVVLKLNSADFRKERDLYHFRFLGKLKKGVYRRYTMYAPGIYYKLLGIGKGDFTLGEEATYREASRKLAKQARNWRLPAIPAMPAMPAMPEMPKMPKMPEMPAMPEMPEMPEMPAMPSIPAMSATPSVHDVPTTPTTPVTPRTPETPRISAERLQALREASRHEQEESRRIAEKLNKEQKHLAKEMKEIEKKEIERIRKTEAMKARQRDIELDKLRIRSEEKKIRNEKRILEVEEEKIRAEQRLKALKENVRKMEEAGIPEEVRGYRNIIKISLVLPKLKGWWVEVEDVDLGEWAKLSYETSKILDRHNLYRKNSEDVLYIYFNSRENLKIKLDASQISSREKSRIKKEILEAVKEVLED